jgi:flagellar hook assembly protein FlgD
MSVRSGGALRFQVAHATEVSLEIVDVLGRRVAGLVDGRVAAGTHAVTWSGRDDAGHLVPAGIYFQRLRTEGAVQSSKLVVIE